MKPSYETNVQSSWKLRWGETVTPRIHINRESRPVPSSALPGSLKAIQGGQAHRALQPISGSNELETTPHMLSRPCCVKEKAEGERARVAQENQSTHLNKESAHALVSPRHCIKGLIHGKQGWYCLPLLGPRNDFISGADGETYSSVISHFIREMYGILVSKSQTHTTASSQL